MRSRSVRYDARMAADPESRTREILRRLSSVPSGPDDARSFMQRRVSTLLGVAAALWGGVWVLDRLLTKAFTGGWLPPGHDNVWLVLFVSMHFALAVTLTAAWLWMRRGERSLATSSFMEAAATLVQVTVYCSTLAAMPSHFKFDFAMSLVLTHVLVLRAAIVPTSPSRTAWIGAFASLPVIGTTVYMHTAAGLAPLSVPTFFSGILPPIIWAGVTMITTTVMSSVIYGLRQRVEAAMELGQYTLLDKIGEGGMGVVYRARHALLRRPTAVKLLRAESAKDASIARFEREVQLTADISHPNIVSVYDFGRTPEGSFYYAMEFLCGIDLQRLVTDHGPQPPERVLPMLVQAADALAEAHAVGLVHRDVKPANMILCNSERHPDRLKMFDFGLVKSMGPDVTISHENALTGTPLYLSPEAIKAPDSIDGRADLYALGAVGYFLLTGKPVFEGGTVFEVCAQHLHQAVVPPSERAGIAFPKKLEALLLACLSKSPADRPASASALREALLACDDVPSWSSEDARRWWAKNPVRARAQDDGASDVVKTLAVAPRRAEPVKRASA